MIQRIVILNSKGGSGKSTLATNLAGGFASRGEATMLVDHDPQGSSIRWLDLRPAEAPAIHGVAAFRRPKGGETRAFQMRVPPGTRRMVVDSPAAISDLANLEYVQHAHLILVPVLPSPVDIHAVTRFIQDLLLHARVRQRGIPVGIVANRVRANTLAYSALRRFLRTLKLPLLTYLRDTQHYVRVAGIGLSVLEMRGRQYRRDQELWEPLLRWIDRQAELRERSIEGGKRDGA